MTACSSPVEKYIVNDFARVVREDGLDEELKVEANRLSSALNDLAAEANPEAKEAKELAAKAKKWEQEIMTRLNNYKRTGDYSYIINIYNDGEQCEAMAAKANRLANKARPYEKHKEKQIKAFVDALDEVDGVSLMNSADLEKDDSVTVQYVFNHVVGTPAKMVTASEETLDSLATVVLTNYFIENPTPTVKAHKYQKDKKCWYITLSDDTHYYLNAIKCDNGEYDYEYEEAENSLSLSSVSSGKSKGKGGNIDKFLDDYEKFANSYAKNYKKLYKKSAEGDMTVLIELQKLSTQAAEFAEHYKALDGELNAKQIERYNEITLKLTAAMSEAMMSE
jgi:hypothetical protein